MTEGLFLPRQTTPYTCGAACLAAIGRLLGFQFNEMDIASDCGARPLIGIDNAALEEWAKTHLPVADTPGEFPSIWNIRNPISGIGHYVVALGLRNNKVRYYDPLYACVQEFSIDEVDWRSGCGKHVKWRLDFRSSESFYDKAFLGDPHEHAPAGKPIPEFVMASLNRYLENHRPSPIETRCPQGGSCSCTLHERCELR